MSILNTLARKKIIKEKEISSIEEEARTSHQPVESILKKRGIEEDEILAAKSQTLSLPTRELGGEAIPFEVLGYIPEESARHYGFAPLAVSDGALEVGMVDPDNLEALDALNFISTKAGMPFKVFLISEADFKKILEMYKGLSAEVTRSLSDLETELTGEEGNKKASPTAIKEEESIAETEGALSSDATIKEDAPVTKMVATILRYAADGGASDIHIEPTDTSVRVRFRIDGVLNTSLVLPLKVHRAIVARIKILTSMRLDEKRKPQDGRFSAAISGRKIDFRVSTFPSYYGEKVVMRILDTERGVRKLNEMGFSERDIAVIRNAITRPYGLILISGPTGSGKTTTLYAMLQEIDRDTQNVLSLEDPVEYNIPGMNQSQVRPEIGYTFATGLRTTLRQDPDIIMVGEIRDKETAQLAIQAALTGHLVLSTIHTNNAIGVIPRLVDMGVDPYLIAPTLILAMAQRLVRTLCPKAGKPLPIKESLQIMVDKQFQDLPPEYRKKLPFTDTFYGIQASAECPNGTRGRTAVVECMPITPEIEHIILTNPVDEEIWKVARKNGMLTMKEDAILKSMNRTVPFEEINTLGRDMLSSEPEE